MVFSQGSRKRTIPAALWTALLVLCAWSRDPLLAAEMRGPAGGPALSDTTSGASPVSGGLSLAATVVPAPGLLAEVRVPSTGVVFFATEPPKNIGDAVQAGETLCVIEYRFNYHDYAHLYTERWPLLKAFLDAKRRLLEARLAVQKARYIYDEAQPSSPPAPEEDRERSVLTLWALRDLQQAERDQAEAEAEFEGSKRRLERHDSLIARTDLTRRPLVSPISGKIMEAAFNQGQLVYEGETVYRILDLSRVWIRAEVFESDISRIQNARRAVVTSPALAGESFPGRLVRVGPRVTDPGRTLEVFFEVVNSSEKLKIGMLAKVSIDKSDER